MIRNFRKSSAFSTATGGTGWRERLAKMTGGKPRQATAKLEIDDANGELLIFPEIGDVSEIAQDVAVTATDGTHVFTADTKTYTVEVLGGKVVSVVSEDAATPPAAMSQETIDFIEAVAQELEANEAFRATAQASIDSLTTDLATARAEVATLKGLMKHGGDGTGGDGTGGAGATTVKIAGKTIDLGKINLK
jgi:hypothetical protein